MLPILRSLTSFPLHLAISTTRLQHCHCCAATTTKRKKFWKREKEIQNSVTMVMVSGLVGKRFVPRVAVVGCLLIEMLDGRGNRPLLGPWWWWCRGSISRNYMAPSNSLFCTLWLVVEVKGCRKKGWWCWCYHELIEEEERSLCLLTDFEFFFFFFLR